MMKYCIDCKYAEKDIRNKCRTWVCTHPDLLNIVSKRPEDCAYVRLISACGVQGQYYEAEDGIPDIIGVEFRKGERYA